MPDPEERLRDKIVRSRKLAAGIPVTAASAKDEVSLAGVGGAGGGGVAMWRSVVSKLAF